MSTFLLKKAFHTDLAQKLVDDIQLLRGNYYYFLGRIAKWNTSDTTPDPIVDSVDSELSTRSELVTIKKIVPNDVSFVVRRIDWASGTIFAQYDSGTLMNAKNYYVLTDNFQVYKCLRNNSSYDLPNGTPSTVKPTGTSYTPFTTSDGYLWKYMYAVDVYKRNKFLTSGRMPVQRALSYSFYSSGAVEYVTITNAGSGYVDEYPTTITVSGNATVMPVISTVDGRILDVIITNQGSGYGSVPTLTINTLSTPSSLYPENTGGAVLTPVISGGKLVKVLIRDPGLGYSFSDKYTITVTANPTPEIEAKFTPLIYGGQVAAVIIENTGRGYTDIQLTVTGDNGSGTDATVSAYIGASDINSDQSIIEQNTTPGGIYGYVVTNPGTTYETVPTVTITGDGTGATAVPTMINGGILKVTMANPGSGYTFANVVIGQSPVPNSIQATCRPILSPIGGHGKDAVSELLCSTVCLYTNIRSVSSNVNNLDQDFREYGIIKNLRNAVSGSVITSDYHILGYLVTLNNINTLVKDEVLNFGNYRFRVVQIFTGTSQAILICLGVVSNTLFIPGVTLIAETEPSRSHTTSIIVYPDDIDKYSGDTIFVSNSDAFTFTNEQEVTIKTFLTL